MILLYNIHMGSELEFIGVREVVISKINCMRIAAIETIAGASVLLVGMIQVGIGAQDIIICIGALVPVFFAIAYILATYTNQTDPKTFNTNLSDDMGIDRPTDVVNDVVFNKFTPSERDRLAGKVFVTEEGISGLVHLRWEEISRVDHSGTCSACIKTHKSRWVGFILGTDKINLSFKSQTDANLFVSFANSHTII